MIMGNRFPSFSAMRNAALGSPSGRSGRDRTFLVTSADL